MKRTIDFNTSENGFACFENDEMIFEVSAETLNFNVKEFYQAFYGDDKEYDEIVLVNSVTDKDDKLARHVYDTINSLITKIGVKLAELSSENDDNDASVDCHDTQTEFELTDANGI